MKNIWHRAMAPHWEAEQDCGDQGVEDEHEQYSELLPAGELG